MLLFMRVTIVLLHFLEVIYIAIANKPRDPFQSDQYWIYFWTVYVYILYNGYVLMDSKRLFKRS